MEFNKTKYGVWLTSKELTVVKNKQFRVTALNYKSELNSCPKVCFSALLALILSKLKSN